MDYCWDSCPSTEKLDSEILSSDCIIKIILFFNVSPHKFLERHQRFERHADSVFREWTCFNVQRGSVVSSQSLACTASILLPGIIYRAWNYNFDFDLRHLCVALLNYLRSELFQMHSSQAATSLDTLLQHHDHFLYITFYPISLLRLMSSFRRPVGGYLCLLAAVVPSPPEVKWLLPGRSDGAIVEAASVRKGTVWSTRGATFPHQTALNKWLTRRLNWLNIQLFAMD